MLLVLSILLHNWRQVGIDRCRLIGTFLIHLLSQISKYTSERRYKSVHSLLFQGFLFSIILIDARLAVLHLLLYVLKWVVTEHFELEVIDGHLVIYLVVVPDVQKAAHGLLSEVHDSIVEK